MPDFHSFADFLFHFAQKWSMALSNPRQFLMPHFHPTEAQAIAALEFYFAIVAISLVLQAPFLLGQKGGLDEKTRLASSTLVNFVSFAIVAGTWHFAFSILGGSGDFTGTCVAYVYSGAPYIPLISLSSLLMFAGLPTELQHYALIPVTAEAAMKRSFSDPRTRKGLVGIGSACMFGILLWSALVQLRSLSFVHQMRGWRMVGCIMLSIVILAILRPILQALTAVFNPPDADAQIFLSAEATAAAEGSVGIATEQDLRSSGAEKGAG